VSRNEATQHLDNLMKSSSMVRWGRPRWGLWLAGALAAFVLGGGLAYFVTRERSLLAGVEGRLVARQENVFRQWIHATQLRTEEGWLAVIEYFPDKPYFAYRAKQQLARIYLRELRLDQAMAIFKEFADLEDTEAELRAYGLAGQCAVLTMQGKYRESAQVLDELLPIRSQLKDPLMRQMLTYAVKTNREKLGGRFNAQKWQEWLRKQFPDAG